MSSTGQAGSGPTNDFAHALAWYVGGLAILGGAIGYFLGASKSPVVGAALPLLFGLASGAGGMYLAKADLTAKVTRQKLQLFGRAIIAFVLLLMLGTFTGISLRTGVGMTSMFSGLWTGANQTTVDAAQMHPIDAVRMLMLRRNLQAVGASNAEQDTILRAAATGTVIPFDRVRAKVILTDIAGMSSRLGGSIEIIVPQPYKLADGTETIRGEDQQEADLVNGIRTLSLNLAREAGYFSRRAADATREFSAPMLSSRIGYFADLLSDSARSQAIDRWMLQNADSSDAIYDLELQLIIFRAELGSATLSIADKANEEINAFLGPRAEASQLDPGDYGRALAKLESMPGLFGN
jgi:hypothetical protein